MPVSDGIHKAAELIRKIERGDVAVYEHEGAKEAVAAEAGSESFGRQLYKHLMNGRQPHAAVCHRAAVS